MPDFRRGLPRHEGGQPWPHMDADEGFANPSASGFAELESPPTFRRAVMVRRGLPRLVDGPPWPPVNEKVQISLPQKSTPATAPDGLDTLTEQLPDRKRFAPGPALKRIFVRATVTTFALTVLGGLLVLASRGIAESSWGIEFFDRYPGYTAREPAEGSGFPAWLRWNHFLNFFFLALIVRTGLAIRHQKNPVAYWTSGRAHHKVTLNVWFHTLVDILWLVNGVAYVVLLFVSGQWVRLVPTSMDVFPNALSATIQYLSFTWPSAAEWATYNSLQQLIYFFVVFILAPIATVTGVRLSIWWPSRLVAMTRLFPLALARAIHYPTMVVFVIFIAVHVVLVFATEPLLKLNQMYAGIDSESIDGLFWFGVGTFITILTLLLVRPAIISPLANLFGRVTSR